MNHPNAYQDLLANIIKPGSRLYYATRFIPSARKAWQLPLYALYRVLQAIPDECSDPGVARMKLHWWAEQLNDIRQANQQHPLIAILNQQRAVYGHGNTHFTRLVHSALYKLEWPVHEGVSHEDVQHYHVQTRGTLIEVFQALQPSAHTSLSAEHIAALVTSMGLLQAVLNLGADRVRDTPLLPEAVVREASAPNANAQATHHALQLCIEQADSLSQTLPAIGMAHACFSELTLLRLYRADIALMTGDYSQVLHQEVTLSPLRRCWLAWRASRKAKGACKQ